MYLGIEIGGTKLQLGVGAGDGSEPVALRRFEVRREQGGEGIRGQIAAAGGELLAKYPIEAVGVGFGGPVDVEAGRTVTSHQIDGWTDFPLVAWCRKTFDRPLYLSNDSDAAGLAEARFGAGRGSRVVFYTNVGSGIGGALVIDGEVYRGGAGIAAELGHLRPGLAAEQPDQTVEAVASGWAIAEAAQNRLADPMTHRLGALRDDRRLLGPESIRQRLIECEEAQERDAADLLERCEGKAEQLTARLVAEAAAAGNGIAREVLDRACQAFGWGIAQMITLLAPNVVVVGGGVALAGETLFLAPLRSYVRRYVFPPLMQKFQILPAALGEAVVLQGALTLCTGQTPQQGGRLE